MKPESLKALLATWEQSIESTGDDEMAARLTRLDTLHTPQIDSRGRPYCPACGCFGACTTRRILDGGLL